MGDGLKRAKAATAKTRGAPKLTPAQQRLYEDILRRGADRVVAGYKPAEKLRGFGLIHIREEFGAWTLLPINVVAKGEAIE